MVLTWESVLQRYRSQHFQIFTRDELLYLQPETLTLGLSPSSVVLNFLQYLAQPQLSPLEAFVRSVQNIDQVIQDIGIFAPFISCLENASQVAVLYGEQTSWKSVDKWSYLFEIIDANNENMKNYLLAHPPATRRDIEQAEAVLGTALPSTYVQLLHTTNGLGLYLNEIYFICGAGASRAAWERTEVFQPGNFRRENYHEIASYWVQWQDVLAYERNQDREIGVDSFHSNEQHYIPFARTIDDWCFDRTSQNKQGEYPVVLWNHEEREATYRYPDFSTWFVDVVVRRN